MVDTSISGQRVAQFLSELIAERKELALIVCDHGSKFTSTAMFCWSKAQAVKLSFIQPGKSTQNACVESFNGKFRTACLNQHRFRSLKEARQAVMQWQSHYKHVRLYGSLHYLPLSQFTKQAA
jgi:putative transposase